MVQSNRLPPEKAILVTTQALITQVLGKKNYGGNTGTSSVFGYKATARKGWFAELSSIEIQPSQMIESIQQANSR
jgi:hypothetical protein